MDVRRGTGDACTADGALNLLLLYKAEGTIDAKQFHALCDGHRNVLVLLVTQDIASGTRCVVMWMDGTGHASQQCVRRIHRRRIRKWTAKSGGNYLHQGCACVSVPCGEGRCCGA